MPESPREVFLRLVNGIADGRFAELADLYGEKTDVRHPTAPAGDHPLLSRDDLRRHFGQGEERTAMIRFRVDNIVIHETADPEVIVAEFEYRGTNTRTGEPFSAANVIVMRVRDGEIVESRDYIDHVGMSKGRGEVDKLIAVLKA